MLVALVGTATASSSCGSSTATSATSPNEPSRCQVTVSGSPASVPASGGGGSVSVSTTRDCTWSASPGTAWITLSGTTSGQGDGTFQFSVAANSAVSARNGTIAVNGQNFAVSQQAAPCSFAVTPATVSVGASGGTTTISVQAQSGCAWSATSNAPWIALPSGASGNGNGTVQLQAAANGAGGARSGSVTIAGQTVVVNQGAVSCSYSLSAPSQSFDANGGSGTVSVTSPSGCSWTASSAASWVTITLGVSGAGNGAVTFTVAANNGAARSTTVTIAGQPFVVNQAAAAPCTFSISPSSQTFLAAGGTGTVTVTARNGCAWTATSGASWVTITSGAQGTGNGSVVFAVAANTGVARSTTLTVAGQTVTITQDAPASPPPPPPPVCSYTVSPLTTSVAAGGGTLGIGVTTTASCAWFATSNVTWMTIASGETGTGSGTVNVSVASNTGGARTGTLTVAGQTVTVNQAAAQGGGSDEVAG